MSLIKADMERAGYGETTPSSAKVEASTPTDEPDGSLRIIKALPRAISFGSRDGHSVTYEFDGAKLVRNTDGVRRVLLANIRDFRVILVNEGKAINIAFWIPAGGESANPKAATAPVFAHFVGG